LNKKQRRELKKELRLERNAKWSDRIKCLLLLDAGEPQEQIARYLIRINKQWRVCFRWDGKDVYDVEIVDYHLTQLYGLKNTLVFLLDSG